MSVDIENKVVDLSLYSSDFVRNAEEAYKALEKLESAMQFKNADLGFKAVEAAMNRVPFDNLSKSVDLVTKSVNEMAKNGQADFDKVTDAISDNTKGIETLQTAVDNVDIEGLADNVSSLSSKFSALGIVGISVLTNIANTAFNAGKRVVSSLTIDPIKSGFQEYETQINAIQTILANTKSKGTTLKDVRKTLDELNHYADKTIYNFTEMTRNIGTFTAAGLDLETSASAIQGIANLAAVSGSTSEQASRAMYQLSQALSSGSLKLQDWNSVVNAGMGGEIFQEALKKTAREYGENVDEYIKANGSFRLSLEKEWISSEILAETLNRFTKTGAAEYLSKLTGVSEKEITSMQRLVDANTDGTASYDKLAEKMAQTGKISKKEALYYLEMADTAEDAATKVKTISQLTDTLKEAAQSGWTQTWEYIVGDFEEAKETLTYASKIFGNIIDDSAKARNRFVKQWNKLGGRKNAVDGILALFKLLNDAIDITRSSIKKVFGTISAKPIAEATKSFKKFAESLALYQNGTNKLTENGKTLKRILNGLASVLKLVTDAAKTLWVIVKPIVNLAFKIVFSVVNSIIGLISKLSAWITKLVKKISNLGIADKIEKAYSGVYNVFKDWFLLLEKSKAIDSLSKSFSALGTFTKKVTKSFSNLLKTGIDLIFPLQNFRETMTNIVKPKVLEVLSELVSLLEKVIENITLVIDGLSNKLDELKSKIESTEAYAKFIELLSKFKGIFEDIKIGFDYLKNSDAFKALSDSANTFLTLIKDIANHFSILFKGISTLLSPFKQMFDAVLVSFSNFRKDVESKAFEKLTSFFFRTENVMVSVSEVIQAVNDRLRSFIEYLESMEFLESIIRVIDAVVEKVESFVAFLKILKTGFDYLKNSDAFKALSGSVNTFLTLIQNVVKSFFNLVRNVITLLSPAKQVFQVFANVQAKFSSFRKDVESTAFEKLTNFFFKMENVMVSVSEVIQTVNDKLRSAIDYLESFELLQQVMYVIDAMFQKIGAFKEKWSTVGKMIIDGLKEGMLYGLTSLGSLIQKIASVVLSAFNDVFEIHSPSKKAEKIGERLIEGLIVGIRQMLSILSGVVTNVATSVIGAIADIFVTIIPVITSGIIRVLHILNQYAPKIVGEIGIFIKTILDSLSDIASVVVDAFLRLLGVVADAIANGAPIISEAIHKILQSVLYILRDSNDIIKVVASIIRKIFTLGVEQSLTKLTRSFAKNLRKLFKNITTALSTEIKGDSKLDDAVDALKGIGLAILEIAIALKILDGLDPLKLVETVGLLIALITTLMRAVTSANALGANSIDPNASKTIAALGLMILLLARALKHIDKLEHAVGDVLVLYAILQMVTAVLRKVQAIYNSVTPTEMNGATQLIKILKSLILNLAIAMLILDQADNLFRDVIALAAILWVLSNLAPKLAALGKEAASISSAEKFMKALSNVILKLSVAIIILDQADHWVQDIVLFAAILGGLYLVALGMNKLSDKSDSLYSMVPFMKTFGKVVLQLSGAIYILDKVHNMGKDILALAALLAMLLGTIWIMDKLSDKQSTVAKMVPLMQSLSAVIFVLAVALRIIGYNPTIFENAIALGALLVAIAASIFILTKVSSTEGKIKSVALVMIALAACVLAMVGALAIMDYVGNLEQNAKVLYGIIIAIIASIAVLSILSKVAPMSGMVVAVLLSLAATVLAFAYAMRLFANTIITMGEADPEKVSSGISLIAKALVLLGLAAIPAGIGITVLGAGMVVLGVGVALLGVGLLAAGAGIDVFATGLTKIIWLFGTMAPAIQAAIENFHAMKEDLTVFLTDILTMGIAVLSASLSDVVTLVVDTLIEILTKLDENSDTIFDKVGSLMSKLLDFLVENAAEWGEKAFDFVVNFFKGLKTGFEKNFPNASALIHELLDKMVKSIKKNWKKLKKAAHQIVEKIKEGIKEKIDKIKEVAKNIVDGFVAGIKKLKDDIVGAGKWLFNKFKGGTEDEAVIESPSKVMKQVGAFVVEGFLLGIEKYDVNKTLQHAFIDPLRKVNSDIRKEIKTLAKSMTAGGADFKKSYKVLGAILSGTSKKLKIDGGKKYSANNFQKYLSDAITSKSLELYNDSENYAEYKKAIKKDNNTISKYSDKALKVAEKAQELDPKWYETSVKTYERKIKKLEQKNSEAKKKYDKVLNSSKSTQAEKDAAKAEYKATKDANNAKIKELNTLVKYKNRFDEIVKKVNDADKDIKEQEKKRLEDISNMWDDYVKSFDGAIKDMSKILAEGFNAQIGVFDKFEKDTSKSVSQIIYEMESQVKGTAEFYKNLEKLGALGFDTDYIRELESQGTSMAGVVQNLTKATKSQIEEINKTWFDKRMVEGSIYLRQAEQKVVDQDAIVTLATNLMLSGLNADVVKELYLAGNLDTLKAITAMTATDSSLISQINSVQEISNDLVNMAPSLLASLEAAIEEGNFGDLTAKKQAQLTHVIDSSSVKTIEKLAGNINDNFTAYAAKKASTSVNYQFSGTEKVENTTNYFTQNIMTPTVLTQAALERNTTMLLDMTLLTSNSI